MIAPHIVPLEAGNEPIPYLLMIETSGAATSVAVVGEGRCVSTHLDPAQHSSSLLMAIDTVLAAAGFTVAHLDGIVFGRGPGSFTGVRIACCVAQGMALGCSIPVLGVDSAISLAVQAHGQVHAVEKSHESIRVLTLQDARMQECYAGVYEWRADEGWRCQQSPVLVASAQLSTWSSQQIMQAQAVGVPLLLACDALAHLPPALYDSAQPWRCFEVGLARAADFLSWALAAWRAGDFQAPDEARPLYVRDKVAFTLAERTLGSGGNPRLSEAPG